MMKCVILDDEPFAHQVLEHYIGQTPGVELISSFRNAVEAYEYIGKNRVDLLFLDIEMPLINGIGFLKALSPKPQTVFTTAYKEYAFEGFELGVVDYLLKPFSYERFKQALDKVAPSTTGPDLLKDTLFFKEKDGLLNIKQEDILYIEGCKDYIKIVTLAQVHIIYHTLKAILQKLNARFFIQAHRSYLVNRMHITKVLPDKLILVDQTVLPIGQSFKKGLIQNLKG